MHPSANIENMLQSTDDYMNMQPPPSTNSSQTSTRGGDISSATSSCSITSGTPSTDIRFSEYHLDKVQARFTPSEDDDLLDRPPRTYSVGSKLEHTKRKLHIDRVAAEHSNQHRHRAYSVGSRNIKVTRAELTSHSGSHTPSHNSPTAMNHHEINNNSSSSSKNKKSSSAPLLVNNLGRTTGSFDHMENLMEIDYSSRSTDSMGSNNVSNTPVKSSPVNIPTKPNEDYMNMSGRGSKNHTPSTGTMSPYVDMQTVGNRQVNGIDYMDMNPVTEALRTSNTSTSLSSSPLKAISAPRTVPIPSSSRDNHYVDMSPRSYDGISRKSRMTSSVSSLSSAKAPSASDDYLNMSPVNKSLLEVDLPQRSSVPDGYMEMSWNTKNKKSSTSIDKSNENPSSSSDEYINMDFSNNNDGAGTSDSSSSAKDRSISLPIAIQNRYSGRSQKPGKSGSVEGGPPAFLNLTNPMTASISPTRSMNRTRCDSRDSGIVTPSSGSQATIFPFSPGSPIKHFDPADDSSLPRKCLVDGTTGTIRLSEDDIIEEEPRTPVPMEMTVNCEKRVETLSSDYAVMSLGEPVSKKPNLAATPVQIKPSPPSANSSHFLLDPDSENHDYINCIPNAPFINTSKIVTPKPITPVAHDLTRRDGDYALMNPVKTAALSPVPPASNNSEHPPQTATRKSLLLTLSSQEKLNSNLGFMPISEDETSLRTHPQLNRQVSEKSNRQLSSDSGYEMLARPSLSRPNSVNSEKIKSSSNSLVSNRPSSANSERLALSSTSSSTSTLCEIRSQSSSSQTLRHMMDTSAVPSPLSGHSRPESVSSDIHMTSRPPSVTSERELHYASLDLPPCSSNNPHTTSTTAQKMDVDQTSPSPQQTSSSSSSASSQQSQPAFTYAQIDFQRSESLKAQQQQNQSGSKK
jgi:insulin receptor substrate 1